jgi:hypothetical protein
MRPSGGIRAFLGALGASLFAGIALPMAGVGLPSSAQVPPDSLELHRSARSAQARFERRRLNLMPRGPVGSGGACDEHVGRFCTWYEEGDWVPEPETPELAARRRELLQALDSIGALLPGDDWVAGQRVWYRAEAGEWGDAVTVARACEASAWWCDALRGLALHGAGRYVEADGAFGASLAAMDPREARDWRFPERAVDGDGREIMETLESRAAAMARRPQWSGVAGSDPARHVLERFWLLADPLWLVPGNDRRTAHYARWTVSMLRVGTRTPYRLSWGRDLEELTVRHGWELGWEKGWPRIGSETDVVGHKHPEGRDFFPPGRAVLDPASSTAEELVPDRRSPHSLYAPAYAPLFLPMEGQLAVFPRGDRIRVVATHYLPADTSWHRAHTHARPWLDPGDQAGRPDEAGLFLAPVGGAFTVDDQEVRPVDPGPGPSTSVPPAAARPLYRRVAVAPFGGAGLLLDAPAGDYLVSVERWSPEHRRAGRYRAGLSWRTTPPDVASLSDLLLVAGDGPEPTTLEAAARAALARPRVEPGSSFGVVWELGGLGWTPETVSYSLSVRGDGGNVLQRAGRWLGLLGDDEALRLSWEEPGPDEPGAVLRHVQVDPGRLDEGRYTVVLEVRVAGRAPLTARVPIRVAQSPSAGAR